MQSTEPSNQPSKLLKDVEEKLESVMSSSADVNNHDIFYADDNDDGEHFHY